MKILANFYKFLINCKNKQISKNHQWKNWIFVIKEGLQHVEVVKMDLSLHQVDCSRPLFVINCWNFIWFFGMRDIFCILQVKSFRNNMKIQKHRNLLMLDIQEPNLCFQRISQNYQILLYLFTILILICFHNLYPRRGIQ